MKKIYRIVLVFSCFIALSYADNATELEQKLNQIKTLEASFKQQISNDTQVLQSSSGFLKIKKPMRFLWKTEKPSKETVISDGKILWLYEEELEQVVVKKVSSAIDNTPAAFLSQSVDQLVKSYQIEKKVVKNTVYYRLTPHDKNNGYAKIVLGFTKDKLIYISAIDALSQKTRVFLSQVSLNQAIKTSIFTFKIPKEVDVIREDKT